MLARFRHRKTHFLSFYLAVFAILVQTVMPLAHANNINSSDETGFFASLCTSNGVVLIQLDANTDKTNSNQTPAVTAGTQCPLCNTIEQDVLDIATLPTTSIFEAANNKFVVTKHPLLSDTFLSETQSIRAPPYFLSV